MSVKPVDEVTKGSEQIEVLYQWVLAAIFEAGGELVVQPENAKKAHEQIHDLLIESEYDPFRGFVVRTAPR